MSATSSRFGSAGGRRNQWRPPLYAQNHKAYIEEAIVRRREAVRLKDEFWSSTVKYFDRLHNQNERYSQWTSPEMAAKSEEAFRKARLAETRRENLLSRRGKLKVKLEAEEKADLEQLRKMPAGVARKSLKDVREEYERMRMERIEAEQKEAEERMLQHWKINNPEYRELQCKKRFEMVQKAWGDQKVEKEEREAAERRQEEIRLRVEAEKALQIEAEERERQRDRANKIQDWKETILSQIDALKSRRKEEETVKIDLGLENERMKNLEAVEIKRKKIEERRKKADLREYLSRQHRLKLLNKAEQVQKDLEDDKRLLEEMESFNKVSDEQSIREREEKNQRLTWMKDVIDRQKEEEAKRQKEMEMLFSEEAEKMWNKQEAIWRREQEARRRLMDDVVAGLKEQIRVKVQEKQREHELVATERAKVEEAIERLSNDIQREEQEAHSKKALLVEDLDGQVKEKLEQIQRKPREESFRETNELASKLANWKVGEIEPVIGDFRRKKVKWL